MADTLSPDEVGFAEFVAKLISEVFDAIGTSQLDQEQRLAELVAAAGLSLEEYAERYVTDGPVEAELARLFPGSTAERPTAIYAGAPYRPPDGRAGEHPPVQAVLGLRLAKGDYAEKARKAFLTESGIKKVLAAVRLRIGSGQHGAIQELVRRGFPRVMADGGRVNAKLTYQVVSAEEAAMPKGAAGFALPAQPLGKVSPFPQTTALSKIRLAVRPADERAPQTQELQVNVFGEVEISFKTIS